MVRSTQTEKNSSEDFSSSKILQVVRRALLNAAEELVSQHQSSIRLNSLEQTSINKQRNGNSTKKKKKNFRRGQKKR